MDGDAIIAKLGQNIGGLAAQLAITEQERDEALKELHALRAQIEETARDTRPGEGG